MTIPPELPHEPAPREPPAEPLTLQPLPGVNARHLDGMVVLSVDVGIGADRLSSALALLVPAGCTLADYGFRGHALELIFDVKPT